ncbi:hypothetical protein SXIM_33210 [Streptomyces xiamenensis]|uniref:Uncharacterized protein n=1 Tax=Streptomyces xiamenensis TaxID=408015 RepID=A0A0F7FW29_9ACTN|nr:hypothetical protein SXIM_33210 [Streptomyces xiamenensis]
MRTEGPRLARFPGGVGAFSRDSGGAPDTARQVSTGQAATG